ncbi:MAG: stage V sporulation protein AD [Ruminococcus sp.]|jgi:stage V sporulation protein AD|nr:stage V sporulation protein AD [Ruminococcus sp.]
MAKKISRQTAVFDDLIYIKSYASIAGKEESEGPLGALFDEISEDPYFGQETWEQGESAFIRAAVKNVLRKASLEPHDIDTILAGDLLNQCVGSTFGIKEFNIPFIGIYGACCTMSEGLMLGSMLIDGGFGSNIIAATSSHFAAAERQFRFPMHYGGVRTPTAQWTCTASGAVILTEDKSDIGVKGFTTGKIVDFDVKDASNMGAAMAPAAADTIKTFLDDTGMKPSDFDAIVTGDLGTVGQKLLFELLEAENIDIKNQHKDCGMMIFDRNKQDVHAGGSGCGCAASVLCAYFLPKLQSGEMKNILFCATGALMSTTISQQGGTIPGISHAVWLTDVRSQR